MITPFLPVRDPFGRDLPVDDGNPFRFYQWPAAWIWPEGANPDEPLVFGARLDFSLAKPETVRLHVSADQRFELFLDGKRFARGPELSDIAHWMYASFDLALTAGAHRLGARVWYAGDQAGYAQQTVRAGFLCAGEGTGGERFHTGMAPWSVKRLDGYSLTRRKQIWLAPPRQEVDLARVEEAWLEGDGGWEAPKVSATARTEGGTDTTPVWVVHPALLPPQRETPVAWASVRHAGPLEEGLPRVFRASSDSPEWKRQAEAWITGKASLTLPPGAKIRILLDTGEYRCVWPRIEASGGEGARLALEWAESLYVHDPNDPASLGGYGQADKAHRGETEGKYFRGEGDGWTFDGRPHVLESHAWHAGRYALFTLHGGRTPLVLGAPTLTQTGYPMDLESRFASSDPRLDGSIPILWNALRSCSHETYMDCPYYERMMYVGDTRLEALVTYAATRDARLPRKALALFDWSRAATGLTASRYPTRFRQTIPPFSLWWVAMVKDYAWWRDEAAVARGFLPGTRAVLDYFLARLDGEGLPMIPPGWNFHDWVPGWPAGMMPAGRERSLLGWHLLYALGLAAELEGALGEAEFAERYRRHRGRLFLALDRRFWSPDRGLFADDEGLTSYSEHAQSLAILSGMLDPSRAEQVAEGLDAAKDLIPATIYYSHYTFEALAQAGRGDRILPRLDLWRNLNGQGFTTTPEMPEPTRSDCHAWGAHPLYHFFASLLGIRPAAPSFARIRIEPRLGTLEHAEGTMVHPLGEVHVRAKREGTEIHGLVKIPAGTLGILAVNGEELEFEGECGF